jgi:hypothetical protein
MPDDITLNAQVDNTCLPSGKRPNKTTIFIKVFATPVSSWPDFVHPVLAA